VIDQNVSSAVEGGAQTELMTAYFADHPVVRALEAEVSIHSDSFYGALDAAVGLRQKRCKLLLYDLPEQWQSKVHKMPETVAADLRRMGIDAEVVDDARLPSGLRDLERDRVVVLRLFIPSYMFGQDETYRRFRALVLGGRVRSVNNPWEMAFLNKLFLARLSDPGLSEFVDEGDRRELTRSLPWTRELRRGATERKGEIVDLLEHVANDRNRFVLKKGDSYASNHVLFGLTHEPDAWSTALAAKADEGGWIVQEVIPGVWEDMPTIVDDQIVHFRASSTDSPFLVGGRSGGVLRWMTIVPPRASNLQPRSGGSVGLTYQAA
jgi:hypothetical protein